MFSENNRLLPVLQCMLTAFVVLVPACSILETRDGCPCNIFVDLASQTVAPNDSVCVNVNGINVRDYNRAVVPFPEYPDGVHLPIKDREMAAVSVFPANLMQYNSQGAFFVTSGVDFPPLYAHFSLCETSDTQAYVRAEMHKQYCRVNLQFISSDQSRYSLAVKSAFCGYNADGSLAKGGFHHRINPDAQGRAVFNLPRQGDSALMLEISGGAAGRREYALGALLERNGYDWAAPDLEDVSITLDFASSQLVVNSVGWSSPIILEIEV